MKKDIMKLQMKLTRDCGYWGKRNVRIKTTGFK